MSSKILLLTLPLLLAGCSSLSEDECRTMSWYNLGYQDGEQGKTRNQARDYVSTCSEYGLKVDEAEWKRGYDKGLELYCIPELAYSKGKEGQEYRGVCPNDASFLKQYQRGYEEYQLATRLREISDELERTSGISTISSAASATRPTASSATTTAPSAIAPFATMNPCAVNMTGCAIRIG